MDTFQDSLICLFIRINLDVVNEVLEKLFLLQISHLIVHSVKVLKKAVELLRRDRVSIRR